MRDSAQLLPVTGKAPKHVPRATALAGVVCGPARAWTILAWYDDRTAVATSTAYGTTVGRRFAPVTLKLGIISGSGQAIAAPFSRSIPVVGACVRLFAVDVEIALKGNEWEPPDTPVGLRVAAIPGHIPEQYVSLALKGGGSDPDPAVRIPDFATGLAGDGFESTAVVTWRDPGGVTIESPNPRALVAIPEMAHELLASGAVDEPLVIRCFG